MSGKQRREFLAALPLGRVRSFPGAERTLGIAYGAGTEGSGPRSGLRFGLEEARRTAQLPGRELTWLEHGWGALQEGTPVHMPIPGREIEPAAESRCRLVRISAPG